MLDELLLGGEIQETSKKNVLKAIAAQDLLMEVATNDKTRFIVFKWHDSPAPQITKIGYNSSHFVLSGGSTARYF